MKWHGREAKLWIREIFQRDVREDFTEERNPILETCQMTRKVTEIGCLKMKAKTELTSMTYVKETLVSL